MADVGTYVCSASLTTWTTILTTTEALAAEHDTLSTVLNTQVADVLKAISTRYEDYRKRYESLSQKLLAERDSVYGDLKKAKNSYDVKCKEVEEKRQKVDKSHDSSKARAQRAYQTELVEMNNVKVRARIRNVGKWLGLIVGTEYLSPPDRGRKPTQAAVLS